MKNQVSTNLGDPSVPQRNVYSLAAVLAVIFAVVLPCAVQAQICAAFGVDDEPSQICRDEFGRPHIFGQTNRGLFEAYGFAVAQDRLWQLELNRRAARGRLAEIFGSGSVAADQVARTLGYTDEEFREQFFRLGLEEQEIFIAYRDGINRYINEVVAADALNKLPFEFHALGIGVPTLWTIQDSIAFGAFTIRRFGEIGGRELTNLAALSGLIAQYGLSSALQIFDDLRWINDLDAPVTVPATESSSV